MPLFESVEIGVTLLGVYGVGVDRGNKGRSDQILLDQSHNLFKSRPRVVSLGNICSKPSDWDIAILGRAGRVKADRV